MYWNEQFFPPVLVHEPLLVPFTFTLFCFMRIWVMYVLLFQSKERRAEQLGNEAAATMVSVMQKESCSCSKKLRSGCVWHPRLRPRTEAAVWTRQNVMSERNAGKGYWWGVWMLLANLAHFCPCAAGERCLRTSLICSCKSQTQVSPVVSSPSDPMLLSSATERKQTR